MAAQFSAEIDLLLEQYLHILDTYTSLRAQLSSAQSSIQQHIARANFTADRGVRYGEPLYDARMQASRVCRIVDSLGPNSTPNSIATPSIPTLKIEELPVPASSAQDEHEHEHVQDDQADIKNPLNPNPNPSPSPSPSSSSSSSRITPTDPLRMFGILTPPSLRSARAEAVALVADLVPRVLAADAAMRDVELRVRRARKWMRKAVAAEAVAAAAGGEGAKGEADALSVGE